MGWGGLPEHVAAGALASGRARGAARPEFVADTMELFVIRRRDRPHGVVAQALWEELGRCGPAPGRSAAAGKARAAGEGLTRRRAGQRRRARKAGQRHARERRPTGTLLLGHASPRQIARRISRVCPRSRPCALSPSRLVLAERSRAPARVEQQRIVPRPSAHDGTAAAAARRRDRSRGRNRIAAARVGAAATTRRRRPRASSASSINRACPCGRRSAFRCPGDGLPDTRYCACLPAIHMLPRAALPPVSATGRTTFRPKGAHAGRSKRQ